MTDHLCDFARAVADPRIAEFLKNKALKRQYHSLFDWERANVNQFLGLLGEDYKAATAALITADESLAQGMRHFLQLGAERNKIAHSVSAISPDLTIGEIKQRYDNAWRFLQFLCSTLSPNEPDPLAE